MIFASSVQLSFKDIAPMTKQRIPPGRSAASLPRFLGESAAIERRGDKLHVKRFVAGHRANSVFRFDSQPPFQSRFTDWLSA
jgi:hypothetical protein